MNVLKTIENKDSRDVGGLLGLVTMKFTPQEIEEAKEEIAVLRALREKNSLLAGNLALLIDGEKLQEEKNRLIVEKFNEEIKKLKGYLGEVGSLLDNNIVEDNQDPPVTTIFADAFDKITNNECL